MPDLTHTRKRLRIAVAALALLDVAAVGLLVSPLVGSTKSRDRQLQELGREVQQKTRQVEPLRGLDKKIVVARQQIAEFYKDRLPAQNSAISDGLGQLASQSGVRIGQVKYSVGDPEPVGLLPVEIEGDFSGGYLQLARFINSVERAPLFFIVESVDLGSEQAGEVKLQLKLRTYSRTSG